MDKENLQCMTWKTVKCRGLEVSPTCNNLNPKMAVKTNITVILALKRKKPVISRKDNTISTLLRTTLMN